MITGIKYNVAEALKRRPHTWSWAWNTLPRIRFLLPHDSSYYGFQQLVRTGGGLFLDVGANNGITAAGFRRLNDSYRILSIEANRHLEPALMRMKRYLPRFDYMIIAVGSRRDKLRLYTPFFRGIAIHSHTSSSMDYLKISLERDFSSKVVAQLSYDEQTVDVVPIDDLGLEPDIVKIDVEGMDYEVLHGMRGTIERSRPSVMMEFTPGKMEDIGTFFEERSYDLCWFDNSKKTFIRFDERREERRWNECGLQVNLFAISADRRIVAPK